MFRFTDLQEEQESFCSVKKVPVKNKFLSYLWSFSESGREETKINRSSKLVRGDTQRWVRKIKSMFQKKRRETTSRTAKVTRTERRKKGQGKVLILIKLLIMQKKKG